MLYVVDAYNLIGYIQKINLSDPDKEDKLVAFIENRGIKEKDRFLLVFDGKREEQVYGAKEKRGLFTLYFTPPDETADAYIDRYLKEIKNKTGICVVSSDWEVRKSAKFHRFDSYKSEKFLKEYHHRPIQEDPAANEKPQTTDRDVDYWLNQFK